MHNNLSVLIIAPEYPFPPDDGHKLRNYNLFKNISTGYCFDLLTFGDETISVNPTNNARQLGPCFKNIKIVPADTLKLITLKSKYQKIKNFFSPYELSFGFPYYSKEMSEVVKREISSSKYDLIYFSGFSMFLYTNLQINRTVYVVDVIDSLFLYLKNELLKQKDIVSKVKSYQNYIWAKNYEKKHFSKAKEMILISPVDADHVKKNCPNSRVWVIPNGVDTEYFINDSKFMTHENTLLFTGVMDYPPNNECIIYFIKDIIPLVRKKFAKISLLVVGKNPSSELQNMAREFPGIRLTGYVNDIRPYFAEAAIYVAPIISGAGLKNKILEAWAMSMPVVASGLSCGGIDARDGYNVAIANTTKAFADKVIELLSDPMLRNKLAQNGRITAERCYSWKSKAESLEKIFTDVING